MELLRRVVHRGADDGDAARAEAERLWREAEARQRVRERNEEFRAYADAIRGKVDVIVRERSDGAGDHQYK